MIAKRITSVLVLILMILSGVGLNADFHICQGTVKSFALFGEAKSCSGMKGGCSENKQSEGFNRKPCCSHQQLVYSSPDFRLVNGVNVSESVGELVTLPFCISFVDKFYASIEDTRFSYWRPPPDLVVRDIIVLNESFLI